MGYINLAFDGVPTLHSRGPSKKSLTSEVASVVVQGNNPSDALANMGDNLPMDSRQPQPHDIVVVEQIMPTPAKAWILQVRTEKHTADVHWARWIPVKHYRRNAWTPWL